jgi:heme exporter protein D
MNFSSFSEFIAMGNHGLYVWTSYGISLAVLVLNVALPMMARRRYLQDEARRWCCGYAGIIRPAREHQPLLHTDADRSRRSA